MKSICSMLAMRNLSTVVRSIALMLLLSGVAQQLGAQTIYQINNTPAQAQNLLTPNLATPKAKSALANLEAQVVPKSLGAQYNHNLLKKAFLEKVISYMALELSTADAIAKTFTWLSVKPQIPGSTAAMSRSELESVRQEVISLLAI